MKSIKEKAEEYASDITNPVTNNAAFLAYKRGANYVLEQVDHILMDRDLDYVETCDSLFELIEQLKK